MQFITMGPYTRRVETPEGQRLGIATHIPASGIGLRGLSQNRFKEALILYPDRIAYWKAEAFREVDKKLVIIGPYHVAFSLEEVLQLPMENQLPYLAKLASVLDRLFEHEDFLGPLFGASVYFLEDGGILVLPVGWSQQILHFLSQDFTKTLLLHSTAPGRSTEKQRILFAFGVLWYRAVTGRFPFEPPEPARPDLPADEGTEFLSRTNPQQEKEIDIEERKLNRLFPPPQLLEPSIPEKAAAQISSLLISDRDNLPDSHSLAAALEECHQWMTSHTRKVGEEEQLRQKAGEAEYKKRMRGFLVRRTLRKRSGLIVGATIAVILLLSLISSLIGRAMEPPKTAGMDPQEVVETFLWSMNELDHEMMSGATRNGAGSELINSVLQLFATVQVRQAYEGRNVHYDPQKWLDQNKPELPESSLLSGIANLEILNVETPRGADPEELAVVDAKYQLFSPDIREEIQADGKSIAASHYLSGEFNQRFILEKHKNAWFIVEIIPSPLTE